MNNHRTKEGKYGLIYQIAEGVTVSPSRQGTWEVCLNYKGTRDRTRFGKGFDKAIQFAELMVAKLGLAPKVKKEESGYSVEKAAEDWMSNNKAKWSPNTLRGTPVSSRTSSYLPLGRSLLRGWISRQ